VESAIEFLRSLYNPEKLIELIRSGGYVVLAAIVFAETGLFIGFFLPGDSLLFTAGLVAAQGFFNLGYLMLLLSVMAIVGDALGYGIGHKAGEALYSKEDTFWFRRKHLLYAKEFYEKHGGKAIFLARFVPFARTFAPVVAGVAQMSYARFASYNIFGGIFWVCSMTAAGFYLGSVPGYIRTWKKSFCSSFSCSSRSWSSI
jgi:membrane-associated protein